MTNAREIGKDTTPIFPQIEAKSLGNARRSICGCRIRSVCNVFPLDLRHVYMFFNAILLFFGSTETQSRSFQDRFDPVNENEIT